jgi:hypothetical protein
MPIVLPGGRAYLVRDGEVLYDGAKAARRGTKPYTVDDVERIAQNDPTHDWRIILEGDAMTVIYQRQDGRWPCVMMN